MFGQLLVRLMKSSASEPGLSFLLFCYLLFSFLFFQLEQIDRSIFNGIRFSLRSHARCALSPVKPHPPRPIPQLLEEPAVTPADQNGVLHSSLKTSISTESCKWCGSNCSDLQTSCEYYATSVQLPQCKDTLCLIDCMSAMVPSCLWSLVVEIRWSTLVATLATDFEENCKESLVRFSSGTAYQRLHWDHQKGRKHFTIFAWGDQDEMSKFRNSGLVLLWHEKYS